MTVLDPSVVLSIDVSDSQLAPGLSPLPPTYGPSFPIPVHECPSDWRFFCTYDKESNTSACECYMLAVPNTPCPGKSVKHCSSYLKNECSCYAEVEPECPNDFTFTCGPAQVDWTTWLCRCEGYAKGGSCPPNFYGSCLFPGSNCAYCVRISAHKSEYTPRPKTTTVRAGPPQAVGEASEKVLVSGNYSFHDGRQRPRC